MPRPSTLKKIRVLTFIGKDMLAKMDQCLKWRMPVNPMAMPCWLAASMESWSFKLPPGWMMAEIPALAASSTQSRKGKKASEAITRGSLDRVGMMSDLAADILLKAILRESMRLICPAPTPQDTEPWESRMALDLTNLHRRQAKPRE